MKTTQKFFIVFAMLLIFSNGVKAQVDSLLLGVEESPQQLLPEKRGFVKKAFWGEHGLMRTLKISPLPPENRQKELGIRHTMLKIHQFMGIVTVGAMFTTVYFGEKVKSGIPMHREQYGKQLDAAG